MASITVRMDEKLHKKLKIKVAEESTTITQYVIDLLEKSMIEDEK